MRKVDGATDADYFVIGIFVGALAIPDRDLRLVVIERFSDKVLYRFKMHVEIKYVAVCLVRNLLREYFGETNWGLHSPTDMWICVYRPLTNVKVGGAQ